MVHLLRRESGAIASVEEDAAAFACERGCFEPRHGAIQSIEEAEKLTNTDPATGLTFNPYDSITVSD